MTVELFNEKTLQDAIEERWGKYGAHATVYEELLKRASAYDELYEAAREVIRAANRDTDEYGVTGDARGWAQAMSTLTKLVFPMEER